MIDKLKQHEKAWAEFVSWMEQKNQWEYINGSFWYAASRYLPDRELRSLLIEFLDSKGIYLTSGRYYNSWMWSIHKEKDYQFWQTSYEEDFPSRPEAEEQGIIKGIEIYNQKEK